MIFACIVLTLAYLANIGSFAVVLAPDNSTLSARAGTFTNPLNTRNGADPCMRFIDGKFYMTTTQGTDISMWVSPTVEGLKTATKKTLFTDTTAGRNRNIWAPEFWYLSGSWYIYYSAGDGHNDNNRVHVLKGGTNANDPSAGPYTHVTALIPANFDLWAIDGSILKLNGKLYLLFCGSPSAMYIVRMSSPTTLTGNAVKIATPTLDWEMKGGPILEAPEAITIGNVTHIIYSASHCKTDDYALGKLTLTTGANPMLASSWTKAPSPVFSRNDAAGVYGPGHHFMFQDGANWYFAYHAKSAPGQGCSDLRNTRVQPFSINGTMPVFPTAVATGVAISEPTG